MKEVFADTGYWLALLNPKDALHVKATKLPSPPRIVLSLAVQLEVMDAFSAPKHRELASLFWDSTMASSDIIVVDLDTTLLEQAIELFDNRKDKYWSLTDCISFTIMYERGIADAFTGDHHFEQAGFRALLRE